MADSITCPTCERAYRTTGKSDRKYVRCPNCGAEISLSAAFPPAAHLAAPPITPPAASPAIASDRLRQNDRPAADQPAFPKEVLLVGGGGLIGGGLLVLGLLFGVGFFHSPNANQHSPAARAENPPKPDAPLAQPTKPNPVTVRRIELPNEIESPPPSDRKASVSSPTTAPARLGPKGWLPRVEKGIVRIEVRRGGSAEFTGMGSGFIVSPSGEIATCFHVMDGAQSARVVFHDKSVREVRGFVSPSKRFHDLVSIIVNLRGIDCEVLSLAESLPEKGEIVYALGHAKGLNETLSSGIVSAIRTGREILDSSSQAGQIYQGLGFSNSAIWIQTDCPISHGNSGGPLLNDHGEVVGVNSFFLPGQQLNFAAAVKELASSIGSIGRTEQSLAELPPSPLVPYAPKRIEPSPSGPGDAERRIAREGERDRKALEDLAQKARDQDAVQQELNRLTAKMSDAKALLASVESDGTRLVTQRNAVVARGLVALQRSQQIAVILQQASVRLAAINAAIGRRELALSNKFAPIVTDGEPAPYTAVGIAMLQREASSIQAQGGLLEAEGLSAGTAATALDAEARALFSQIQIKAGQRGEIITFLNQSEARYNELLKLLPR